MYGVGVGHLRVDAVSREAAAEAVAAIVHGSHQVTDDLARNRASLFVQNAAGGTTRWDVCARGIVY